MALWAALIVLALALGFATAFLGFAVLMPLLGYATWHGYLDTIEAKAWHGYQETIESDAWPHNRLESIDT